MSRSESIASGIIGGPVGYHCLRWLAGSPPRHVRLGGNPYAQVSKTEILLGSDVWDVVRGRTVLDFGCGQGDQVIEIAGRGARRVIGLDLRERMLAIGRERALAAGVSDRTVFTTRTDERVDVVISLDAFEHFEDPAAILLLMRRLLKPDGLLMVSFGPPPRGIC